MAPPINVQDWYGDRHTCQIASGALAHKLQSCSVQCSLLTNDTIKTPAGAVTHQRVWERKFPSGVQGLWVKGQSPHLENEGLGAKSQKLSDFILLGSNCFDFLHINDT